MNVDFYTIIVFLFITLIVGLYSGKDIKDIAEYAISNKISGGGVLAITILATYITGSKGIGYAGYVFDDGILPILPTIFCGVIFCFLLIILCILPHIKHFEGCLTAAEVMGQIYGSQTRLIMGILGSFYTIVLVTLQILWLGNIGELLGISKLLSILIGGTIIVIYSSTGGIKSVTITDIVQFVAVAVMIPIIAYVLLDKVGGITNLVVKVPKQHLSILGNPQLKDYLIYCIWYLFPAFPLSFPFIQRMLMARNDKQLKHSYYISMFFLIIFFTLLTLIGLAAIVLQQSGDVNMPTKGSYIMNYVINNYFSAGVRGVLIVGLIAAVMSTADSFLNCGGLLIIHDVVKPYLDKKKILIDELKITKYITLLLGIIALLFASVNSVLPRIHYVGTIDLGKGINIGSELVALAFTVPLIAGIMGLKGNFFTFIVPTIITILTFIGCKLFFDNKFLIPISIGVNLLSFFATHYLMYKEFAVIKRNRVFEKTYNITTRNNRYLRLKFFNNLIKKTINHLTLKKEIYSKDSSMFAFFMLFNYMLPFFMYSYSRSDLYNLLLTLRILGGILCIGLLLKFYWPSRFKKYFNGYYYLSLMYCLPFYTMLIFLLENGDTIWLINTTFAIILLIILVDWLVFTILSGIGYISAVIVYYTMFNKFNIFDKGSIYPLIYTGFFSIVIGVIFVRKKQQYLSEIYNNQKLSKLYESTADKLVEALNYQEKVAQNLGKEGIEILNQAHAVINNLGKQIKLGSGEIFANAYQKLHSVAKYLEEIAIQAKDYIRLDVDSIDISSLLTAINEASIASGFDVIIYNKSNYKTIECDINLIQNLIIDTIFQLIEYGATTNEIHLYVDSTELWYRLSSIKDYTKKIPAIRFAITTLEELHDLPNFYMGDTTKAEFTLHSKKDLYKAESIKIINAHYGSLQYNGFNHDHCVIFVIPLRVRDIRPKSMDLNEDKSILPYNVDDSFKIAKIEIDLIKNIRKRNPDLDMQKIKKAIYLIKKYHKYQKRKSGEPFYVHPLMVATILLQYTSDEDTLVAALLHDIVEDAKITLLKIEAMFNPVVAKLVDGVTKFDQSKKKIKLSEYENIQKLIEQEDKRALMIKVADRIHNMRTIGYAIESKQKKIAEQTLQFYVPMAKNLGLIDAAKELQSLVFETLTRISS